MIDLDLLSYEFRRFGGPFRTAMFASPMTQGGSAASKLLYERLRHQFAAAGAFPAGVLRHSPPTVHVRGSGQQS